MSEKIERTIAADAYSLLLHLPLGSVTRHHLQPALAVLRDEIARLDGVEPEEVQTKFETLVSNGDR